VCALILLLLCDCVCTDEATFQKHLLTESGSDPDILIRTSGECRISNFLLYQAAYTELFFIPQHWPEMTHDILRSIIQKYHARDRRYGR
jgi:undecaprenyl diphosphate synthase